jgi:hypothetical protein
MHQTRKKELSESHEYLTCTFCLNQSIKTSQGETRCSVCDAAFEIDDRAECVFGDTNIPMKSDFQLSASFALLVALYRPERIRIFCTGTIPKRGLSHL